MILLKRWMKNKKELFAICIVLTLMFIFDGIPIIITILSSFTNWNGLNDAEFVGISNYIDVLSDPEFWFCFSNSFLILLYVPLAVLGGLIFSIILYEVGHSYNFLLVVYIPQVISSIIAGKAFQLLFSYNGPINYILTNLNIEPVYWLGTRGKALSIIIFCLVWLEFGWQVIYFWGFLLNQSYIIKEMLLLDGASQFEKIVYVYIPLLKEAILSTIIITVLFSFNDMFSLIFSITDGGPGNLTTTVDYMIYKEAFLNSGNLSRAGAMSVIVLICIMALLGIGLILGLVKEHEV